MPVETSRVTLRIPLTLHRDVTWLALCEGASANDIMVRALQAYVTSAPGRFRRVAPAKCSKWRTLFQRVTSRPARMTSRRFALGRSSDNGTGETVTAQVNGVTS